MLAKTVLNTSLDLQGVDSTDAELPVLLQSYRSLSFNVLYWFSNWSIS